jgi:hypothetical protein
VLRKAAYLDIRNTKYGFQPTAIVHSLPQVAFIWASFLFTVQGFWMTIGQLPGTIILITVVPIVVVSIIACYGICVALCPREKPLEEATQPAFVSPPTPSVDPKDLPTADSMV